MADRCSLGLYGLQCLSIRKISFNWKLLHLLLTNVDEKAMALLPLAVEYQIGDLQKFCEHHLAAYDSSCQEYQEWESRSYGSTTARAQFSFARSSTLSSPPSSDTYYYNGRFNYHQQVRMVKLAEDLNLEEFRGRMINKCAAKLRGKEIDRQRSLPENKGLSDKSYNQIIR